MSRSYKKPVITISKAWTRFHERGFRHRVKQALRELETDFDPDADWEEATLTEKGLGEYGTRLGMPAELSPDDSWYEEVVKLKRK